MNHKVFVDAAKLIDDNTANVCCYAIDMALGFTDESVMDYNSKTKPYIKELASYFKSENVNEGARWFGDDAHCQNHGPAADETRAHRIMALLMLAEMMKSPNKFKRKK